MTRYSSTNRGAGAETTRSAIRNRQPFRAGNLVGVDWGSLPYWNQLPTVWRRDFVERQDHVDYVVYSYQTPIAWYDAERNEWVVPPVRHSNSTTAHQGMVSSALEFSLWRAAPGDPRSHVLAAERRAHELFEER